MSSQLPAYDLSRIRATYGLPVGAPPPTTPAVASTPSTPAPPSVARERAAYVALARVCLQGERWSDLLRIMREVIRCCVTHTPGADLTTEERSFLIASSKNILSSTRAAWRIARVDPETAQQATVNANNANANNPTASENATPENAAAADAAAATAVSSSSSTSTNTSNSALHDLLVLEEVEYQRSLERELYILLSDLITIIEGTLIKNVLLPEPQVFYRKLLGDFYRYLAEVSVPGATVFPSANSPPPSAPTQSASSIVPLGLEKKALEMYQSAWKVATNQLDSTHPTRLGLMLNYSVLLFEIFKDKKQACELARQAFDMAISKLDDLEDTHYKDSTLLMQLLRDNITLWTAQDNPEGAAPS